MGMLHSMTDLWMTARTRAASLRTLVLGIVVALCAASTAHAQTIERISGGDGASESNGISERPRISGDGSAVVFSSEATNLVSGDTNSVDDVFVVDRSSGTTTRVSVGAGGAQADAKSGRPVISADGRFVAFYSDAANLIDIDLNAKRDVFVHDRQSGVTELVSVATVGFRGDDDSTRPTISADGRYIAYRSKATTLLGLGVDTNGDDDIFLYDRIDKTTIRVSVNSAGEQSVGGDSDRPAISADGRYIAFSSRAHNLVAGDQPTFDPLTCGACTGAEDVFVYDRIDQTTVRVSVASNGTAGDDASVRPAISSTGRFVAFESRATNLVAGDTNGVEDIFVHDRDPDGNGVFDEGNGVTIRANVAADGTQADHLTETADLSADGRYVMFRTKSTTLLPGVGNGFRQVFMKDRETGAVTLISADGSGLAGNDDSSRPSVSSNGQWVAFFSDASSLIATDTNAVGDVFVRDVDSDGDGYFEGSDNCPGTANADQADADHDGLGDICDDDRDGDGFPNAVDGCPDDATKSEPGVCGCGNPELDSNNDGEVDCGEDTCPDDPDKLNPGVCGCGVADTDTDQDGVPDCQDNCVDTSNPDQLNSDTDAEGDACDPDDDNDGVNDDVDNCPVNANASQADGDGDGLGDACDATDDTPVDNGPTPPGDGDGTGDGTGVDTPPGDNEPGANVPDDGTPGDGTPPAPRTLCGSFGMITFPLMMLGLSMLGRGSRRRRRTLR